VISGPLLLLWLLSPVVGWWISQPIVTRKQTLSDSQQTFLRGLARQTWRYFEVLVNAGENWLPPDNVQEVPTPMTASRTSPTNIGMALLANLAAGDFGYLSIGQLLDRTDKTLTTMERLERYRGHFYNWYDTRTLKALHPFYVSSVDSGNLAGALHTLRSGLLELKSQPILQSRVLKGCVILWKCCPLRRLIAFGKRCRMSRHPTRRPLWHGLGSSAGKPNRFPPQGIGKGNGGLKRSSGSVVRHVMICRC